MSAANACATQFVEIDLILKGIKTQASAFLSSDEKGVEIDLILKGIKTDELKSKDDERGHDVEIDLILKGITSRYS